MDGLHAHDTRNARCQNHGCWQNWKEGFAIEFNNGSRHEHCGSDCRDSHLAFLLRKLPELEARKSE